MTTDPTRRNRPARLFSRLLIAGALAVSLGSAAASAAVAGTADAGNRVEAIAEPPTSAVEPVPGPRPAGPDEPAGPDLPDPKLTTCDENPTGLNPQDCKPDACEDESKVPNGREECPPEPCSPADGAQDCPPPPCPDRAEDAKDDDERLRHPDPERCPDPGFCNDPLVCDPPVRGKPTFTG